jgi:hypothetical protein
MLGGKLRVMRESPTRCARPDAQSSAPRSETARPSKGAIRRPLDKPFELLGMAERLLCLAMDPQDRP